MAMWDFGGKAKITKIFLLRSGPRAQRDVCFILEVEPLLKDYIAGTKKSIGRRRLARGVLQEGLSLVARHLDCVSFECRHCNKQFKGNGMTQMQALAIENVPLHSNCNAYRNTQPRA